MKIRILVIENESNWQNVIQQMLPPKDYDLTITASSQEAKQLVVQDEFDLVIANINLIDSPEKFNDQLGLSFLEFLKDNKISIPRIVMTGNPGGPVFSTFSHCRLLFKYCSLFAAIALCYSNQFKHIFDIICSIETL